MLILRAGATVHVCTPVETDDDQIAVEYCPLNSPSTEYHVQIDCMRLNPSSATFPSWFSLIRSMFLHST